jgi:hypothetical protein
MNNYGNINYFARSAINKNQLIGLLPHDRRHHVYIIGKTGMGKSTMIENMIISDIQSGCGVGLIDPHGDLSKNVLANIPTNRIKHVVYVNPADIDWPVAFNILEKGSDQVTLLASQLISVFHKIWQDSWGPRLEHLLRNTILALLETPSSTLLGASKILTNDNFRKQVIQRISDPVVKSFWTDEFEKYPERFLREVISPLQNKLGALLTNHYIRNIVGQKKSLLNIEDIIESKKILIVNLSKGQIGEDASRLLGTMLVTKIQLVAMAQAKFPEKERKAFFLYIDEFQNFSTSSFIDILSEARKYKLSLVLAHQYLKQLDPDIKNAVLGNAGTMVAFRVGAEDAKEFESEFAPACSWLELTNLFPYEIYAKLMLNGKIIGPYLAETLPPIVDQTNNNSIDKVINNSRKRYCRPKNDVERKIHNWIQNPSI